MKEKERNAKKVCPVCILLYQVELTHLTRLAHYALHKTVIVCKAQRLNTLYKLDRFVSQYIL